MSQVGCDVLGSMTGEVVGASFFSPAAPDQYLVVHVKNVQDVVKAKGGSAGGLAFGLAPATITAKVYGEMQKQFQSKLAEQGVQADVSVVASPPVDGAPRRDLVTGMVLGAGTVGIVWVALKFILGAAVRR